MVTIWPEIKPPSPCPDCNRPGRCKIAPDRRQGYCFRNGRRYVLAEPAEELQTHALAATHPRADDAEIARVNAGLVELLSLHHAHRRNLWDRGLSTAAIARNGYRSLPWRERRTAICEELIARMGWTPAGAELQAIPGFCPCLDSEGIPRWTFGPAASGLVIPCCDLEGRIVALKVRLDRPRRDGTRYVYLSGHGGASNTARVHLPRDFPRSKRWAIITEGELKADVAVHLSGWPILSVPGVSIWKPVFPVLKALSVEAVAVAFDADFRSKPEVAEQLLNLLAALKLGGYRAALLHWQRDAGKGLDDALLAAHGVGLEVTPVGGE